MSVADEIHAALESHVGPNVGVGVDCEEIASWRKILEGEDPERRTRIFAPQERDYCDGFEDRASVYAGRWCAKEAVVKSLSGWLRKTPRDITILSEESGKPTASYSNDDPTINVTTVVSIAHDERTAMAFAVSIARFSEGSDGSREGLDDPG